MSGPDDEDRAEDWDERYLAGEWDRLDSIDEIAHYMVALGYLSYGPPDPKVLDVGCGHGRLLQLLQGFAYSDYLGLDISGEAIRRAEALGIPRAHFATANVNQWEPGTQFDVVIFNESLYYATHPLQLFLKAMNWLTPQGVLIVSMFRYDPRAELIWNVIERLLDHNRIELLGATEVTNSVSGYIWDVRATRRR
jgi:trans-aconitate methyltransferase